MATCTKVYDINYLNTDHWQAIIRLLGRHCSTGVLNWDASVFCVKVIELMWDDNGVVLGDPRAQRTLFIAREHGNHFVPVLPLRSGVQDGMWRPW